MKSYRRVIREFNAHPWAILPEKLNAIVAFLELKANGVVLSEEEIAARIGAQRNPAQSVGSIAIVPVYGVLAKRMDMMTAISGGTSADQLTEAINVLVDDSSVSAIVLDVDSPGGSVAGMTEAAGTIRAASKQKPIIAISNNLMASAAYWLGSGASEIVVSPSAMIGSIGVFNVHVDETKKNEQDGLSITIIRSGPNKAIDSGAEPLTDEARAEIQSHVDYYADLFRSDVAKGRSIPVSTVLDRFGEGKVFNAKQAVALGVADRVGTLGEVIADLIGRGAPTRQRAAVATSQIAAEVEEIAEIQAETEANAPIHAEMPAREETADERARRLRLRLLELS
jgi:signal peptide peptidase SppA